MKKEEFLEILIEEVFSESEQEILTNTKFKELDCWDSITALTLIAVFDSEFSLSLTGDNIKEIDTIDGLFDLLK
jgi:acyl carrier protein